MLGEKAKEGKLRIVLAPTTGSEAVVEFYKVLQSFTEFYQVLQGFKGFWLISKTS